MGEEFARRLAREGFSLLLVARRADRLHSLAKELGRRRRIEIVTLAEDLGEREALGRIVAAATSRDVGLVVSNAGFGLKGAHERIPLVKLEAMLAVNARAPMVILHELLPSLLLRGRGGVILTGSVEGEAPFPWSSAYAATKAFVQSLGLGIAGELAGTGVDVLVLEPGATDTEALKLQGFAAETMPGLMKPADVARQALAQLGRVPIFVPGAGNRKMVSMLRRMKKEKLIEANAAAMAAALSASGQTVGH
jgi:short-subunit dehydrogenase